MKKSPEKKILRINSNFLCCGDTPSRVGQNVFVTKVALSFIAVCVGWKWRDFDSCKIHVNSLVWRNKPSNANMVDMNLCMHTTQPLYVRHLVSSRRNERSHSFLLALTCVLCCLLLWDCKDSDKDPQTSWNQQNFNKMSLTTCKCCKKMTSICFNRRIFRLLL